jgi:hypothetical protein
MNHFYRLQPYEFHRWIYVALTECFHPTRLSLRTLCDYELNPQGFPLITAYVPTLWQSLPPWTGEILNTYFSKMRFPDQSSQRMSLHLLPPEESPLGAVSRSLSCALLAIFTCSDISHAPGSWLFHTADLMWSWLMKSCSQIRSSTLWKAPCLPSDLTFVDYSISSDMPGQICGR